MSANGRQRRGGRNRRSGDRPRPAADENGSPNTVRADVAGEPKPPQLPRPYVVEPANGAEATCSLLLLHGFACSGRSCAESWLPQLEKMGDARDRVRLVFLNAPRRKISCYGPDKPTEAAWHDYFSDHGGAEGRPEIEEDIDLHDLAESRRLVHAAMDGEAARYGGDYGKVALFGESQGGCTALDAATTHAKCVGGVFCSFGQLYSATPVSSSNKQLRVVVWHGSRDATIAPSLCLRSLSRLLDRGYKRLTLHVEDGAGQESEIPNFKGSYLGRFPLVLADFWTSDHLSERSRCVGAFAGTRASKTLTLKRRRITLVPPRSRTASATARTRRPRAALWPKR